jgi:hypothetical protein
LISSAGVTIEIIMGRSEEEKESMRKDIEHVRNSCHDYEQKKISKK